MTVHLLFELIM